jgi:hypothetical protein
MSPFDHNSKTRISIVNPLTGNLETPEPDPDHENILEATQVRSVRNPDSQPMRRSAEFIPLSGNRPADEVTSCWKPPQKPRAQLICQYLRSRSRVVKITLPLGFFAIALSICTLSLISKGVAQKHATQKKSPGAPHLQEKPRLAPRMESIATTPPATPLVPIRTEPIRTKNAVDALFEGRLEDAFRIYKQLHQLNPKDPQFKLAIEILSRPSN